MPVKKPLVVPKISAKPDGCCQRQGESLSRGVAARAAARAPQGGTEAARSRRRGRNLRSAFALLIPEPQSELEYVNPFTLLVAVVLSAQATDIGVNKATRALFAVADTPQKMPALGEAGLQRHHQDDRPVSQQGEERHRAVARCSWSDHGGEVPHDAEALEALPGVGRKTANVVLNIAFGEQTIAVDTHIFRVANRIRWRPARRRSTSSAAREDRAGANSGATRITG